MIFRRESIFYALSSLSSILITFLLYSLRDLDDNRLTSWAWTFSPGHLMVFSIGLSLCLLAGWVLIKCRILERYPVQVIMIISYLICMVFWQEPEVIIDASRYFIDAKFLSINGAGYFLRHWGQGISAWTDMPLVPLIYGTLFRIFGEHRLAIQCFNTIIFSSTVLLAYKTGKDISDRETGILSALFLLSIPYLYTQVPLMLVDVFTMFAILLSVYAFMMALRCGGVWIFLSGVSIFLSVYAKYSSLLFLTVLFIQILLHLKDDPVRVLRRASVVGIFSIFLILPFIIYHVDVFDAQVNLLMTYQRAGLKRWSEGYISTFLFQMHPFVSLLAVVSMIHALRRREYRLLGIVFIPAIIFLLGVKRIRYTIPAFPFVCIMAAYGLQCLKGDRLKRCVAIVSMITSIYIATVNYLPFLKNMGMANLMHAGSYMNSIDEDEVTVFVSSPQEKFINPLVIIPILDLYTDRHINFYPGEIIPPPDVQTSSLRFTWEVPLPYFYKKVNGLSDRILIVIKSAPGDILRGSIRGLTTTMNQIASFQSTTERFLFSPAVYIYCRM